MGTSRSTRRVTASGAGFWAGLALPVLAASFGLGIAGCNEDRLTKTAYEQTVRSQYASVQAAFEATRDTSGATLAARLRNAQKALLAAAEGIEAKEPPKQVEEETEEIVEGLRDYAEQIEPLIEAATAGRSSVIDRFNASLAHNEAVEKIAEAAEELKFKGYDLGAISEE